MTFASGAVLPIVVVLITPTSVVPVVVGCSSLALLALLGAIGAKVGGAPIVKATLRVAFWGALAMLVTAGIGKLIGKAV